MMDDDDDDDDDDDSMTTRRILKSTCHQFTLCFFYFFVFHVFLVYGYVFDVLMFGFRILDFRFWILTSETVHGLEFAFKIIATTRRLVSNFHFISL